MKTKILTIAGILLMVLTNSYAQRKTYLGIEGSVGKDIYHVTDNGNELSIWGLATTWGFNISQEIYKNFSIETGIFSKEYGFNVKLKSEMGFSETNSMAAFIIPLRCTYKINLLKHTIFLVPTVGANFCINYDYYQGATDTSKSSWGYSYTITNGDTIGHSYFLRDQFSKNFILLQTGLGIEFKLFKTADVCLNFNYYTGFKKIILADVKYNTASSMNQTANAYSKGGFWNIGLSIKYPISDFWQKKKV